MPSPCVPVQIIFYSQPYLFVSAKPVAPKMLLSSSLSLIRLSPPFGQERKEGRIEDKCDREGETMEERKRKGNKAFPLSYLILLSRCSVVFLPHRKEGGQLVDILPVSTECSSPKYFTWSGQFFLISTVISTL